MPSKMKTAKPILTLLTLFSGTLILSAANPADTNRDRSINLDEFSAFKKNQMKSSGKEFSEKQIKYLFEDKDHDGDGVLSYREFGSHAVDKNGDKSISYSEFLKMHNKRAERNGNSLKEAWVQNLFKKKDTDNDGSLSYKELAKPVK